MVTLTLEADRRSRDTGEAPTPLPPSTPAQRGSGRTGLPALQSAAPLRRRARQLPQYVRIGAAAVLQDVERMIRPLDDAQMCLRQLLHDRAQQRQIRQLVAGALQEQQRDRDA